MWESREKKFAQQVQNGHLPRLPKAILDKTEMWPGLELYWHAYSELSTCRPSSFGGLLPIPWTAIDRYAERHEFDDDQFEWLVHICRALDAAMAKHSSKES